MRNSLGTYFRKAILDALNDNPNESISLNDCVDVLAKIWFEMIQNEDLL